MNTIFIGFIFAFLNFNLHLGDCTIGLIPNFIGYILIAKGANEMKYEEKSFGKIVPFSVVMSIYSLIEYIINIFSIEISVGIITTAVDVVFTILSLYITYAVIKGIARLEKEKDAFESSRLKAAWLIMAVVSLLFYVSVFVTALQIVYFASFVITTIVFLGTFNSARKLYNNC